MLCKNPYPHQSGGVFPCGQCAPCRVRLKKQWVSRILLEQKCHDLNTFITLTYNDDYLPRGNTLVPRDLTLFLKRLRKALAPRKIRYFAVGEYGEQNERPHYHAILFGVDKSERKILNDCWQKGFVHSGEVTSASVSYTAGYIQKKLNGKNRGDDEKLKGRSSEFSRSSRRPGIGALSVGNILEALTTDRGCDAIIEQGGIPNRLKMGQKNLLLNKYLRNKIKQKLGDINAKEPRVELWKKEMQELYAKPAQDLAKASKISIQDAVKQVVLKTHEQEMKNFDARQSILNAKIKKEL